MVRALPLPRRLIFSAIALVFGLALLEGALQVAASVVRVTPKALADGSLPPPDPEAFRIVGVGDSWVWGAESPPEAAFLEVLARGLREQGRTVQVFNLGAPGSNSAQAFVRLAEVIDSVRPDLVITLTGSNDLLHDTAIEDADRLLGRDPRMTAVGGLLGRSRVLRILRLIRTNLRPALAETPMEEVRWAAPSPLAPQVQQLVGLDLPWFGLYGERRWDDALAVLRTTPPPNPSLVGLAHAWEALLLAELEKPEESERAAILALAEGGDDATAWEARARAAELRGEGLFAMGHRVRAASTPGHPWIRERARGLALLDLEDWEFARAALLGCEAAVPGNLEVLMALSRIPGAARDAATEAALERGPRGLVQPWEYLEWHVASSGDVERAVASLGEPEEGEAPRLRLARARALEWTERRGEAAAAWADLHGSLPDGPARDLAIGGLLRTAPNPAALVSALGPAWASIPPRPLLAPALLTRLRTDGLPSLDLLRIGRRAMDLGLAPLSFEVAMGSALDPSLGWIVVLDSLGRGPAIDLRTLRRDGRPSRVEAPPWPVFLRHRLGILPWTDVEPNSARALAALLAGDGERALAFANLSAAEDPATAALVEALVALLEGRTADALLRSTAGAAASGPAWSTAFNQGLSLLLGGQPEEGALVLVAVDRAVPGLWPLHGALARVPERFAPPEVAVLRGRGPSGGVPLSAQAALLLGVGHRTEARILLSEGAPFVEPASPEARARVALLAVASVGEGPWEPATAALLANPADCAAARAAILRGVLPGEVADLSVGCLDRPAALALALETDRYGAAAGPAQVALRASVVPPVPRGPREEEPLARHLDGMARLARSREADFFTLTYPFPSEHHRHVAETIVAAGRVHDFEVIDLHHEFQSTLSAEAWAALRTPEDHVNAEGYARMGAALLQRVSKVKNGSSD